MGIKNSKFIFVLIFVMLLLPYKYIGENFSNVIILLALSTGLIFGYKSFKVNKLYSYSLTGLILSGIISLFFTNNMTKSLSGLCFYIALFLFYIFFLKFSVMEDEVLTFITIAITGFAVIFIFIQGGIYNARIDGNLGYANTYALILLIALYLNEIIKKKNLYTVNQIILIGGILYTESRNTLLYLGVFIIINCIYAFISKRSFSIITNFAVSFISYILIKELGFGTIFIFPLAIYAVYYFILNRVNYRVSNIINLILISLCVPAIFLSRINFVQRVKNISPNLGVLQERFLYFQDVLRVFPEKMLGFGIGSFEYNQYMHQSAFYDVRYIHNSVLQAAYDLGIIGAIFFIAAAVIGFFIIWKSESNNKKYYLPIYITIYLHSLLDFDFSFVTIGALTVMLVAFSQKSFKGEVYNINLNKYILSAVLIFSVYLFVINGIYSAGEVINNLEVSLKLYNFNKYITIKDPDVYFSIAEVYKLKSKDKDMNLLKSCAENLRKAEEINPVDPRIIGNLAVAYGKLGQEEKAIEYYEKFFKAERYYSAMYKQYYDYLLNLQKIKPEGSYGIKIDELKEIYKNSYSSMNKAAKYMKDQLPENFEEAVK